MANLKIKKGTMELVVNRSDVVDVNPSHDGVVFQFKNNVHLYVTDPNMPVHTKELIRNTNLTMINGDAIVDLLNYNRPVTVSLTEPNS